jgi:hypothetical protein
VDGYLPDAPSPTDVRAVPNLATLPREADLREHCSPVEDQGQIGSCVANAVVGALEYQIIKGGRPKVELSRMFVYFNARRMSGDEHHDSGSSIAKGMAAFMAFGAPPESEWPYDPNLLTRVPDPVVYKMASLEVPPEYARLDGFENVRASLARGFPVAFAALLPDRFWGEVRATGRAKDPTPAELAEASGGHAMLLVGYDLNSEEYLVRNSWGEEWGENGYFRIGFDALEAATRPYSTWILGKLDAGDFTIHRPKLEAKPIEGGVKEMAAKMRAEIRASITRDLDGALKDIQERLRPKP